MAAVTPATTETQRLAAFSDAVFAIAATLLVLNLHVPPLAQIHTPGLWTSLAQQSGSYVSFVLSFMLVGLVWINHHTMSPK